MQLVDEKIRRMEAIDVPQTKRPDFDQFWKNTMDKVKSRPLNVAGGRIDYPIKSIEARDISFEGLDGTPIKTWVLLPQEAKRQKVPVVISYHGAGGSRGTPTWHLQWLMMGAAVISHDYRMQGGSTGSNSGFMGAQTLSISSLGILDRESWYFYHAHTDALRVVELAKTIPEIDQSRICLNGGSQGGGEVLFVASFYDGIKLCMADVPSNGWLEKRLMDASGGYGNIAQYLRENPDKLDTVCDTMSYFDNINHVDRIKCPTLISLGLRDPVCPPENVYAMCNKISARKEIVVYPFGEHGGGGQIHNDRKLEFYAKNVI